MKYSLRIFGLILCLYSAGCHRNSPLSEPIKSVVQSGASQLDMSNVAHFAWDEVFVFGPYTPKDSECQILRHSESQCTSEGLRDVDESEAIMVFLHNASVIRVESIPRTIADFDVNCLNKPFKRAAARFLVEKRPRVFIECR